MKLHHLLITLAGIFATTAAAQKAAPFQGAPNTKDYPGMPRYESGTSVLQSPQKPVTTNSTDEGRTLNRRVELVAR